MKFGIFKVRAVAILLAFMAKLLIEVFTIKFYGETNDGFRFMLVTSTYELIVELQ